MWKTPAKFSPIANVKMTRALTKEGDCSWNPQPMLSPPLRNTSNVNASDRKATITPILNDKARVRRFLSSSPPARTKLKALIEIIGSTHGIKLSSKPPVNAKSNANASEDEGLASCGGGDANARE